MSRVFKVVVVAGWLILGTPVHAQQRTAQEETKQEDPVVYTNADLPPEPVTAGPSLTAPPPASAPSVAMLPALPTDADHLDKDGHGEGWWRQRAAELDVRILEAWFNAQKLHVDYVRGKKLLDPTLPARSREATLLAQELEAERDRLPDELRRAGGLPGWLRRGDVSLPSELLPAPEPEPPTHTEGLVLSWKTVPRAAFYIVEVQCRDCCGLMEACEVRSQDVAGTSARFPFETGRSGRWRVRALDAAGFPGEWSPWGSFEHPPR